MGRVEQTENHPIPNITELLLVSLQPEDIANLSDIYQWPGRLAATLLGSPLSAEYRGALVEKSQELVLELPRIVPLVSMAILNTLVHAKKANDLARRDALLDELRALASNHPDQPAVREPLANALFNTLCYAKEENDFERRDKLLDELRDLAENRPDEPPVHEWLAKALLNTMVNAKEKNNLQCKKQEKKFQLEACKKRE